MCRILLIIHLVPLVLVELFVCRKYTKVWPKWWQTRTKEASGHGRATCPTGQCPRSHLGATWHFTMSLICGSYPRSNVKSWSKLVCTDGRDGVDADPPAHRHTHGGSNRPWNRLTGQVLACGGFTTAIGSQPAPLTAKMVHPRVGRCPYAAAQRPLALPTSLLPTSTPHASLHYK
jgi:hypothetical protein